MVLRDVVLRYVGTSKSWMRSNDRYVSYRSPLDTFRERNYHSLNWSN